MGKRAKKKLKKKQGKEEAPSLLSSIFGDDDKDALPSFESSEQDNTGAESGSAVAIADSNSNVHLFTRSHEIQQSVLQHKRQRNNKRKRNLQDTVSSAVGSSTLTTTSRQAILAARQNQIDQTKELVASLSVAVPPVSEDEEIARGDLRVFVGRSSAIFRHQGVLILKQAVDTTFVQDLNSKAETIQQEVCSRLKKCGKASSWESKENASQEKHQATASESFQYHEVASRCFGRLDIRHQMDQPPFCDFHEKQPWLGALIHSLLGCDAKLVYTGLILSFADSLNQPWHQDGTMLFDDCIADLPPYALNVFIPLDRVTPQVGPTEFWVGSHKESACRQVMEQLRSSDRVGSDHIVGPLLERGEVLVYDYRICHRGTSNLTKQVRPMLYLMYARPWFHEHLNFGSERLFVT